MGYKYASAFFISFFTLNQEFDGYWKFTKFWFKLHKFGCSIRLFNTDDIRCLEYPLSRTLTMLNFLSGPFSIVINFSYKFVRYVDLRYLELSLCRSLKSFLACFPFPISNIRMRFSNESYC